MSMFMQTGPMRVLIAVLLLGAAGTSHAWSVLGCTFGPNVEAFISCVNNASSNAVDAARDTYEGTIGSLEEQLESLQSSPYLAELPGEQAALLALRDMPIEQLHACLAENDLSLGAVMGGAVANPLGFTQARLNELMDASVQLGEPLLGPSLQSLGAGQLPDDSPQAMAAHAQRAYDAVVRLAQEDPVARCALPMITPLAPQIQQAAVLAYHNARNAAQQLTEQTVRPVLEQALMASLGVMLDDMQGQPAPSRRESGSQQVSPPPGRPAFEAPARRLREQRDSKAPAAQRPSARRSGEAAKPALRTRSIRAAGQAAVASTLPDDVRRIALAVFTERMLDPRRMDALTQQIHGLSAALANGSAGSFDLTELDKLIDELAVPSDQMAADIGLEVARFYGHWVLDKAGGKIVDVGIGSVSAADALAKEVAAVICAIGHVPVEGGCAAVKGIASSLYLMIGVPVIKQGMMASFHVAWEQTVNCAAQAIRAGHSPAGISTATCGPLGPLARRFPTGEGLAAFVLPQIDASRSSLFAYQQAVRNLAQVSHAGAAAARR